MPRKPSEPPSPSTSPIVYATPLGVERIVSGGQTGVDRAALDVALALNIRHGGWCPLGRMAEDGRIPEKYKLRETEESEYSVRTERNVLDSTGTLLIYQGRLQRGTLLTYRYTQKHDRPALRVRLDASAKELQANVGKIQAWLVDQRITELNVAGPRSSSCPGIGSAAFEMLMRVFSQRESLFE